MPGPGRNYPPRKDVLDKQRQLAERQRKDDIAKLPPSGSGASTWIECDNEGSWLTPPGGYPASQATVDWGVDNSDVYFSPDVVRIDASTFQLPAGTYFFEWVVWGWVWHWTSTPAPFDGDGWIGFNAGVASVSESGSAAISEYGPLTRVRANFNGDTVTVNDAGFGGYQDAVVLASGAFSSYQFPGFPHDKFSLALSSIPELYEQGLATDLTWSWPFTEDASLWSGDHWLRVIRLGDSNG